MTMPQKEDNHRRPSRPVMREVAERAGVAMSSVSRVLSGHPDVSSVMRNRVLDAVAALGYQPDLLAQSLRTGATMTVGFLVGDISNPLMSQIALGAEVRLRDAGYSMLLTNSVNDAALDVAHVRLLRQRRVDGLLMSVSDESAPQLLDAVRGIESPLVLVDRQLKEVMGAQVLSDHAGGIEAAVRHLAELGHRRIGLINGSPNVRPSRERSASLRRVCRSLPGLTSVVRSGGFTAEHGYRTAIELMRDADAPSALIAGSNQILVGVLHGLRELGLRIPQDVSLVTCDDIALSEFLTPPITTITRDPKEMGRVAAELLLEQLGGRPPRLAVLPTGFRPTASCDSPRSPRARRVING